MTELEHALVALGRELDVPAALDVAPRVRARLEPRRPWARPVALALVAAALAVAVAFAIPPARSAILRFFHLGGATIERVDTLPRAQERPLTKFLGLPVTRKRAETIAGFAPLVPLGVDPSYYAWAETITLFVRVDGNPVLISETRGPDPTMFEKKYVAAGTHVEPVRVDGQRAFWIAGAPHVVEFQSGEPRLAGNVLLFLRRNLTIRIEADISRSEALDLARSLR